MAKRPKVVVVEPIRARAVRGPRAADGRYYWRAEVYRQGVGQSLWAGWAHRDEVAPILRELDPARQRADGEIRTIEDLLRYWLGSVEDRADLRPRSVRVYRTAAREVKRHAGLIRVDRLTSADVERIRSTLIRCYAPCTASLAARTLDAALRWGWKEGALDHEPPRVPRIKAEPTREKRTPTSREVALVVDHLDGWHRMAVLLLWGTGARIGEVASLRGRDYDANRGALVVRGKTGPREVPLPVHVAAALDEWTPGDETLLGVTPGTCESDVQRGLDRACERAQVRRFTPHGLRRLAVDRLVRAGVDVATAADLLGHSIEVMLRWYRQVDDADRRRAVAVARLGLGTDEQVIDLAGRTRTRDPHSRS